MRIPYLSIPSFLVFIFFLSFLETKSQDTLKPTFAHHYLLLEAGGSFSTAKTEVTREEQKADGSSTSYLHKLGFGKGVSFGLGYQYLFNKDLGLEFQVNRLQGTSSGLDNSYYVENGANPYFIKQHNEYTAQAWKFQLLGVIKSNYQKISPYMKAGLVAGKATLKTISDENVTFVSGQKSKGEFQFKSTGGWSIGYVGVVGLDIKATRTNFFFIELNYTSLSYTFDHWERTVYKMEGKDLLSQLPASDKSGTYSSPQPTSRRNLLPWSSSLSSVSIMVGYKVALSKQRSY